jgi:hypothetical protein
MLTSEGNGPHYEILLGYDEPRGNVILLDPVRGEVLLTTANFEQVWARCSHFTLLASRGQEVCLPSGTDRRERSGEPTDQAPSN